MPRVHVIFGKDANGNQTRTEVPFTVQEEADWDAREAASLATPYYVPMPLIRERLEDAGKWEAAVNAMTAAQRLKLATLRQGVLNTDATAIALCNSIGVDPAVILARE